MLWKHTLWTHFMLWSILEDGEGLQMKPTSVFPQDLQAFGPKVSSYVWLDISKPLLVFKPAASLPSATCLTVWKLKYCSREGVFIWHISFSFLARCLSGTRLSHCQWPFLDSFGIFWSFWEFQQHHKAMLPTGLCLNRSQQNSFIKPLKSTNETQFLCLVN